MPQLLNTTRWRSHPHSVDVYLYVHNPEKIYSASVNQTTFEYPIAEVTLDNVTLGIDTDPLEGMTVKVLSSTGEFKGWARVRDDFIGNIARIGHVSAGEINFENDDLIEVYKEYRLWNKIQRIDPDVQAIYKDWNIAFTATYGTQPNPVCNAGSSLIGFIGTNGKLSVDFNLAGRSFAIADSATMSSFGALLDGGTVVSGTVASGVFTVEFTPGIYECRFEATDSNGKTHLTNRLVVADDRENPQYLKRVTNLRMSTSLDRSWTLNATLIDEDLSTTQMPEGAFVMLMYDEIYDGVRGSLGGQTSREQVKFVGYTTKETIVINPVTSEVKITAVNPLGKLENLTAFSQTLQRRTFPENWSQMSGLDITKFLWYLIYWHTSILDFFDWDAPTFIGDYQIAESLDAQPGNLKSQIEFATNAVGGHLTCDFQGVFYTRQNPQVQDDTFRAVLLTVIALSDTDWYDDIEVEQTFETPIYWLRGYAVQGGITPPATPLASIAPGVSPGQGGSEQTANQQIVQDQTELNVRTGRAFALANNKRPRLSLRNANAGLIADPAWLEWITFTLSSTTNKRGISYSNTRFILQDISIDYDFNKGVASERWTLQEEIFGQPGTTVVVPTSQMQNLDYSPYQPYRTVTYGAATQKPVQTGYGTQALTFAQAPACYALTTTRLYRTRQQIEGSPVWEEIFRISDMPHSDVAPVVFSDLKLDPWNPKRAAYVSGFHVSGAAQNAVYMWYVENLDDPVGSQVITELTKYTEGGFGVSDKSRILASINVDGAVILNGGNSWNSGNQTGFYIRRNTRTSSFVRETVGTGQEICMAYGNHATSSTLGKVWISQTQSVLKLSSDMGDTISNTYNPVSAGFPLDIHLPYNDNANDNILYLGFDNTSTQTIKQLTRRNEDGSFSYIAPFDSGLARYVDITDYMQIHTYTHDRLALAVLPEGNKFFVSSDGGDTWTQKTPPSISTGRIGGWPYTKEILFMWGASSNIYWTSEAFSSGAPVWTNIKGNLGTLSGNSRVVQFVPVWVP